MNFDEFTSHLEKLDIKINASTLRRWASEKIITPPKRLKHSTKRKLPRGRTMEWSEKAVEEAAAVWAIRRITKGKGIVNVPPSRTLIPLIKHSVSHVYEYPTASYTLPSIADPSERARLTYTSVEMKLPYEVYKKPKPPRSYPDEDTMHALEVTWIAATEKAKHGRKVTEPVAVVFNWNSRKIDETSWTYDGPHITFEPPESGKDEIVFKIDGVDTRKQIWDMIKKLRL